MQTATPASQAERALCARFQRSIPERVNADPHLVWRGRTLSVDCLVQIGSTAFLLRIERGSIRECRTELPLLCSWDLDVRGTPQAWTALWQDPADGNPQYRCGCLSSSRRDRSSSAIPR